MSYDKIYKDNIVSGASIRDGKGNRIDTMYLSKDEFNTFNPAKNDLSNLTEGGLKVIKDNSGSGLEVCDIGMALYVDETKGLRRYLNGQIVDINTNTQAFLNRLKQITTLHPSLLCTEDEWQTAKTMSAFGQVGKFVFNYADDGVTVVSVRIPRIVNVQGVFDLQNLGLTVVESLPNHTHNLGGSEVPLYASGSGRKADISGADGVARRWITKTNGSNNTIYKDNAHVQPEAIQYPYFIQIATGAETENNIVNDIELNNPYSLFDSKYSDHELNNLSWLKSNGQWNAKAVYPTAYDKLLKVYNGTEAVEGLSVKLSTETYTDYDFVLNTSDETFRLPLLDGSEDIPSDRHDDLELKASGSIYTAPANGWICLSKEGGRADYQYIYLSTDSKLEQLGRCVSKGSQATLISPVRKGEGFKVSYTAEGVTNYFRFIYAKGNGSLYYYVGETVQNANLIDAGRIGEQLATKTDMLQASGAGMPSGKYIDLTLGASGTNYTAPANGYFTLYKIGTEGQYIQMVGIGSDGNTYLGITTRAGLNSGYTACMIPCAKGKQIRVNYSLSGDTIYFRFCYAVGSESEAQ